MTDPFQDLNSADPELVAMMVTALEKRAADPTMIPIIDAYLDLIDWSDVRNAAEIGSGTGPIARMIARRAPDAQVIALEPSEQLTAAARDLAKDLSNMRCEVADGRNLPLADGSQDLAIFQTVLSHVTDAAPLVTEAARTLRVGGSLVICDADFSKATLAIAPNDPLHAICNEFVRTFVTDPHLIGKLARLATEAGLKPTHFSVTNRVLTAQDTMRNWIEWPGARMVADGVMGQPLLDALIGEYNRRMDAGTLYGFQPFATLIAVKR